MFYKTDQIRRVAILGAGTMGAGIGLSFALGGLEVMLFDISKDQLASGIGRINQVLELLTAEEVVSSDIAERALPLIKTTMDFEKALADTQMVIEAVPEVISIKHDVFKEVEDLVSENVVLVSNTSGLSINNIASVLKNPERFAGFHWFNPPELVPLVEVIRGKETSDVVVETLVGLARLIGKEPIVVNKDILGFVANRMQYALLREALQLVTDEIARPEDIDIAIRQGVGFRWSWLGPLETADLGGLDVFYKVSEYLFKDLSSAQKPQEIFSEKLKAGCLGIKSGEGFYKYLPEVGKQLLRNRDIYFIRQTHLVKEMKKGCLSE